MSIKKKFGMGLATAALGVALIGGGTFAYFSDAVNQTNTFASGTINLAVDPVVQIPMENIKPGDWMPRSFELQNNGTLDIKYVDLKTSYTVSRDGEEVGSTLANKYAENIMVQFLKNTTGDEDREILFEVTLKDLRDLTPEDLAIKYNLEEVLLEAGYWNTPIWWLPFFKVWVDPVYGEERVEEAGLTVGEVASFDVQFKFINDEVNNQNDLQNLDLDLTWTFEGYQTDGEQK